MSADLETTRVVRSWLQTDERESADRVLADVLSRLDSTPQRHRLRSATSVGDLSAYAKLAIAAAAVIVVAVVAVNRLPASGSPGGSSPVISPSAQASETPSVTGKSGLLVSGRRSRTMDGVRLSVDLPTLGWENHEVYLSKDTTGPQGAEAIILWTNFPEGSNYVPCLGQPEDRSMADLAAAVSTVAGTDLVSGPSDVVVGGRAAKHVKFFVTYRALDNDLVCSPGFLFSWDADIGGAFWDNWIPGDTISVWIVDVDGTPLVIEAATHWNAGPAVEEEIQQIIDSIQFE